MAGRPWVGPGRAVARRARDRPPGQAAPPESCSAIWKDGDLLPAGASCWPSSASARPSVREALRIRRPEGLVSVRRGKFGCGRAPAAGSTTPPTSSSWCSLRGGAGDDRGRRPASLRNRSAAPCARVEADRRERNCPVLTSRSDRGRPSTRPAGLTPTGPAVSRGDGPAARQRAINPSSSARWRQSGRPTARCGPTKPPPTRSRRRVPGAASSPTATTAWRPRVISCGPFERATRRRRRPRGRQHWSGPPPTPCNHGRQVVPRCWVVRPGGRRPPGGARRGRSGAARTAVEVRSASVDDAADQLGHRRQAVDNPTAYRGQGKCRPRSCRHQRRLVMRGGVGAMASSLQDISWWRFMSDALLEEVGEAGAGTLRT